VSGAAARAALGRLPTLVPLAAGLAAVSVLAGALTSRTETLPHQLVLALPLAAVAAAAYFALAAMRPAAALAIAFALLAVVTTDPAPPDLAFALVIVGTLGIVPPPALPGFVLVPLVLLTTVTLASAMNAHDTARAIEFAGITVYLVVLAVWLTGVFRVERYARIALKAYLVAAALSGLLGVLALYVGFPGSSSLLWGGGLRARGLFQDPNVYGPFLVPAAAIMLEAVARGSIRTRDGLLAACGFVAASAGVVVAYSRAGWLAYALAVTTVVVVQAFRRGGPRAAARGTTLLGCGIAAAYLMLSATGSLDFFNERSTLQSYDAQRFDTQSSAFDLMTTHVLGFGPGQTEVELAYATHSLYARAAYEQGLFGLALLVIVLLVTLWCALVVAARARTVFGIGTAALLGSWIGLIANSFFIDTLHWRHLWIFAAVIWTAYVLTGERSGARRAA
jgi:O-antigen ligase